MTPQEKNKRIEKQVILTIEFMIAILIEIGLIYPIWGFFLYVLLFAWKFLNKETES